MNVMPSIKYYTPLIIYWLPASALELHIYAFHTRPQLYFANILKFTGHLYTANILSDDIFSHLSRVIGRCTAGHFTSYFIFAGVLRFNRNATIFMLFTPKLPVTSRWQLDNTLLLPFDSTPMRHVSFTLAPALRSHFLIIRRRWRGMKKH